MRALVVLNFTSEEVSVRLPYDDLLIRVGNYADVLEEESCQKGVNAKERKLRPWEGRLYMTG